MAIEKIKSTDPKAHVQNIAKHIHELMDHCREDVKEVEDPRAKALFETTAEALGGLEKAMNDYKAGREEAWK